MWQQAASEDQVVGGETVHNDSKSYKKRVGKMGIVDPQFVWVEQEEEEEGWEGGGQVLGSLVLQWLQDSKVSEDNTEGNEDLVEGWVAV